MGHTVEKEWEAFGLACVVLMTSMGHRCGYVGVPNGHRLYKIGYDDAKRADGEWIDVHGGLTFAGEDKGYPSEKPNTLWWFGYDCAHLGDAPDPAINPSYARLRLFREEGDTIRSLDYCVTECERLA